jgi:hypothetical protein
MRKVFGALLHKYNASIVQAQMARIWAKRHGVMCPSSNNLDEMPLLANIKAERISSSSLRRALSI